jgi:oligoendopeptidase F
MPTLAHFDYEIFSLALAGQPLTAFKLKYIMLELFVEGYEEMMKYDLARKGITWAQFLHLDDLFYTFHIVTRINAVDALVAKILGIEQWMGERYIGFISAGGSLYMMDFFDLTGADISMPASVEASFKELDRLVD